MNKKLEKALSTPMKHISDVRNCFNLCANKDDVEEVLRMIPRMFGDWGVTYSDDGETFVVLNTFFENNDYQEEEFEYDFYDEASDRSYC